MSMTPTEAERFSVRANLWSSALSLGAAKISHDTPPSNAANWCIEFANQAVKGFDDAFKKDWAKAARIKRTVKTPKAEPARIPEDQLDGYPDPTSH